MTSYLKILSALVGLCLSVVRAADLVTPSSDGCVDNSGMKTCLNSAASQLEQCGHDAQDDIQLNGCILTYDITLLGCYIERCWNKVYSCEYQLVVVDILSQQYPPPEDPIPFWPPPENAPGGCVCNFGVIYDKLLSSLDHLQSTCNEYMSSVSSLQTCQCCAWSSALSAFYGTCPGYDLTNYGLAAIASTATTTETMTGSCSDLTSSVCEAKFGIASFDDETYPDPGHLPDSGSKTLTTTEGPGQLTTPPGGATITGTFLSIPYTLTAASYNAEDVQETGIPAPTDSSQDSPADSSTSSDSTAGMETADDSSETSTESNSALRHFPVTIGPGLLITLALVVIGW